MRFELAEISVDDGDSGAYALGDGDHTLFVWFDAGDEEWWIANYVKADEGVADNYRHFK